MDCIAHAVSKELDMSQQLTLESLDSKLPHNFTDFHLVFYLLLYSCIYFTHLIVSLQGEECLQIHFVTLLNPAYNKHVRACSVASVVSESLQPHGLQPARPPLAMGFFRQEYQSGLPCPPPGDLPNLGIEPVSPSSPALQADYPLSHLGSPI